MKQFLIKATLVVISILCTFICIYKEKVISFITRNLKLSKLIKRILFLFFVIFGGGTLIFIVALKYFKCPLETLNSYFYLLSSLTTIFATFVATFLTQHFTERQKKKKYLATTASVALIYIKKLRQQIYDLYWEFDRLKRVVEFDTNYPEDIPIIIKEFQEKYNKVFPENVINFDLYSHTGFMHQTLSSQEQSVLKGYRNSILEYKFLLDEMLTINEQDCINTTYKNKMKERLKKTNQVKVLKEIEKLQRLLEDYIIYT